MITEIIGYAASFLVAISLVMVSIVRLRFINLAGAVTFVVYGTLIGSIPIILTNGFITAVNVYYLQKLLRRNTRAFAYLPAGPEQRQRMEEFIEAYEQDVRRFYPLFQRGLVERALDGPGTVYLCLKNLKMVGIAAFVPVPAAEELAVAEHREAMAYVRRELFPRHTVYMPLDYVAPKYRDIGLVNKLYHRVLEELQPDSRFIVAMTDPTNATSHKFLRRNGYERHRDFGRWALYVRTVPA
jgi:ribosomal protein S18 acetylase RimI-like enzyme